MRDFFYVVTKGGVRFDVSFTPYQQSWQLAGIFDIEYKQAYHNTTHRPILDTIFYMPDEFINGQVTVGVLGQGSS